MILHKDSRFLFVCLYFFLCVCVCGNKERKLASREQAQSVLTMLLVKVHKLISSNLLRSKGSQNSGVYFEDDILAVFNWFMVSFILEKKC